MYCSTYYLITMHAISMLCLILFTTVGALYSRHHLTQEIWTPFITNSSAVTTSTVNDSVPSKTEENKIQAITISMNISTTVTITIAEENNTLGDIENVQSKTEENNTVNTTVESKNEETTRVESVNEKYGTIYISDCYLSTMIPGETKTKMMSSRNTEPNDSGTMPGRLNLYVWDSNSATERPPQQIFMNNINRYNVTIRHVNDYDHCLADDKCFGKEKRIIDIRAADVFRKVEEGRVPPYTIMGENWSIKIMDCYLDDSKFALGTITTEDIYIGDNATERLPFWMSTISTKLYNITIRSLNDYDHCVIADAPCWPIEKRFIDIKLVE